MFVSGVGVSSSSTIYRVVRPSYSCEVVVFRDSQQLVKTTQCRTNDPFFERRKESLQREFLLQLRAAEPAVVSFTGERVSAHEAVFTLTMDYVPGVDLCTWFQRGYRLTEKRARSFMRQLLEKTYALHRKGIAHRDLKPENIMVSKDHTTLTLIDYGLAYDLTEKRRPSSPVGTREYVAPEVEKSVRGGRGYDGRAADVYSLGCVFIDLWRAVGVWRDERVSVILQQMIEPSADHRISLEELREHAFFKET